MMSSLFECYRQCDRKLAYRDQHNTGWQMCDSLSSNNENFRMKILCAKMCRPQNKWEQQFVRQTLGLICNKYTRISYISRASARHRWHVDILSVLSVALTHIPQNVNDKTFQNNSLEMSHECMTSRAAGPGPEPCVQSCICCPLISFWSSWWDQTTNEWDA